MLIETKLVMQINWSLFPLKGMFNTDQTNKTLLFYHLYGQNSDHFNLRVSFQNYWKIHKK